MSSESRLKDNKSSLAHRAQQKYNVGKFVEAIDALQKLSEEIAPERDLKVQHNLVLAHFVSGKYDAKEFEGNLRNLLGAVVEDGEKRREQEKDTGAFSMERESCFIRYNLAACLFQQKQYASASAVLEVLMRNIEPIDEKVAMHVCFLYLDIILHSSRGCVTMERERLSTLKKAQSIMAYLEKPHAFNGLLQPQCEDQAQPQTGGNGAADGEMEKQPWRESLDIVEFRFRMHLYRAKIMLLQSNLKVAKKEVKSALEIFQKELKTRELGEEANSHAASSPSNMSSSGIVSDKTSIAIGHPSQAVQNTTALFLKANLEYLRKNYKKCVKLLASCTQQAVDESIFLNNMGCIHFQMGQRRAAQSYFARALESLNKSSNASDAVIVHSSSQYEIMYNNGVQLLLQGQYAVAFRCFHVSSRLFFNRPKLWLRLGECCTAAFAQQQKLGESSGTKSQLIQNVVGSGSHRRVLLGTNLPESASQDIDTPGRNGKNKGTGAADNAPKMSLPFAAKCFKNVVLLCNQLMEASTSNGTATPPTFGAVVAAPPPSMSLSELDLSESNMSVEALDTLRQKALINLAYVYLGMFEPHLALSTTQELLALETCSKSNRFLARSYAAEALCMLSRAEDATSMLQSERELMGFADEYAQEAKAQPTLVRAGVHVNNATTLILQNKVAEAEESVTRAVRENPGCRESLELLVYVLLRKGDTKKALRVLKEAQVVVQ